MAEKENAERFLKQLKDTGSVGCIRHLVISQEHCSLAITLTVSFVSEQEDDHSVP